MSKVVFAQTLRMKSFQRFSRRLATSLLNHRWLIIVSLGISTLLFEWLEHWGENDPVDAHFVREILFFGIIFPVAIGLLLNRLLRTQDEHHTILRQQGWDKQFQQQARYATHWDERLRVIVYFPELIAPVAGVVLFKQIREDQGWQQVAASWFGDNGNGVLEETAVTPAPCGLNEHLPEYGIHPMSSPPPLVPDLHGYCLPLWHNNRLIGLLQLYLPEAVQLSDEQIGIFNHLAPAMALALDTAVPENPEFLQAEAARQERERLARQLHDTLGQHLAYLRLKLDQLTMEELLQQEPAILQDLERMRDIANEAYEQTRHAIITLEPDGPSKLVADLLRQAQLTAEQADFALKHQIAGTAVPLPLLAQQKILGIFREALTNIQRHAQAKNVELTIVWSKTDLMIALADDGVGFNTNDSLQPGHFGLLIMQQRAEEIQGQLSIASKPEQGTSVTLQYPLNQFSNADKVLRRNGA
jgi:signal transduction histidine kinase